MDITESLSLIVVTVLTFGIPIAVAIWFFRAFNRLNESVEGIRGELSRLTSAPAARSDIDR